MEREVYKCGAGCGTTWHSCVDRWMVGTSCRDKAATLVAEWFLFVGTAFGDGGVVSLLRLFTLALDRFPTWPSCLPSFASNPRRGVWPVGSRPCFRELMVILNYHGWLRPCSYRSIDLGRVESWWLPGWSEEVRPVNRFLFFGKKGIRYCIDINLRNTNYCDFTLQKGLL